MAEVSCPLNRYGPNNRSEERTTSNSSNLRIFSGKFIECQATKNDPCLEDDKWFDHNEKTRVSKAGKLMRKILERHFSVDTPDGRKLVQLILGGVKHTYRLKVKQEE